MPGSLRPHTEEISLTMRTNALLLAVAMAAGGSLFAQTTSKNIVGYVNKTVPKGKLALIANPLNNGGNKVSDVIKISDDLTLFHFTGSGWVSSLSLGGDWIEGGDVVIAPGGGFFASNTGASDVKITFVGEVAVGTDVAIPAGISIRSSVLPQAGKLETLEYPVGDETIYTWTGSQFAGAGALGGEWLDGAGNSPAVAVADAFFVINDGAAKTWKRTFTIN